MFCCLVTRSSLSILLAAIAGSATKRILVACICLTSSLAQGASDAALRGQPPSEPEPFDRIDVFLEELQEIMGMGLRRPVRARTISKARFLSLYERRMREQQDPQKLHGEELFLRLFGLIPDNFDYRQTVLDLMSEQAWALYDFKQRILYLADWAPADAREFAVVHELVHAIDDQAFNLRRYVGGAKQAEEQLARLAVVEGQASWVMTEWVMRQSGRSLQENRMLASTTATATRFEAEQFPVYERTPLYFRELLLFPYTDGLLFQHDLIERFGIAGLKRAFAQPPRNTQQILQPDLYVDEFVPDALLTPREPLPKRFKRVYKGTFGQLDHRILLEHHLGAGDRRDLLDKWRGGVFEVFEDKRAADAVLKYAVRWADPEAADEYYQLYRQLCERKWEGLELVTSGRGRCEGVGPAGRVRLELRGTTVQSVEGWPLGDNGER